MSTFPIVLILHYIIHYIRVICTRLSLLYTVYKTRNLSATGSARLPTVDSRVLRITSLAVRMTTTDIL